MAQLPLQNAGTGSSDQSENTQQASTGAKRIKSEELFQHQREVEIEHQGRIYRLRVTQLNKLILTA